MIPKEKRKENGEGHGIRCRVGKEKVRGGGC